MLICLYKYFKQVSSLNVLLVNLCKLSGNTNKTKTSSFLSEFHVFSIALRAGDDQLSAKNFFEKFFYEAGGTSASQTFNLVAAFWENWQIITFKSME